MNGGERGSVLIEAVIAVAIIAGMVAAFMLAAQDVARRAGGEEARRQAMLIAQSRLAAASVQLSGPAAGSEADFDWRFDVAPYRGDGDEGAPIELIRMRVSRAGQTPAMLTSARLAR